MKHEPGCEFTHCPIHICKCPREVTPQPPASVDLVEVVANIIRDNVSGPAGMDQNTKALHRLDQLTAATRIIAAIEAGRQDAEPVAFQFTSDVSGRITFGKSLRHCPRNWKSKPLFDHPSPDLVKVLVEALQMFLDAEDQDDIEIAEQNAERLIALVGEGK